VGVRFELGGMMGSLVELPTRGASPAAK
jgi:hypothetical protein